MFVCGLCMEICLDVVVNEMNLDIQERDCLVQRTGILMSEFDARVNRIQVARYEDFQMLLSKCPNHEDMIDEPPPNDTHEQIGVRMCHAGFHTAVPCFANNVRYGKNCCED